MAAIVGASAAYAQAQQQQPQSPPAQRQAPTPRQPLLTQLRHAQTQLDLELGAGYSDNIGRVDSPDEDSASTATLGLAMAWRKETRRLEADIATDLSYFEYGDNAFESEVVGEAHGLLSLGIVPDRFVWNVADSFGQAQSDPFSPVTPDNRENINNFTTGPTVSLRLGSVSSLRLFGSYAKTSYEESPNDSDRTAAGVGLIRHLSDVSEVGLNAVTESTDFDALTGRDYDRESAYLSYIGMRGRTDVTANLGYSRLKPDTGDSDGGLLATLLATRRISASSVVAMELGRQFTDAGETLGGGFDGVTVGGSDITASADPFQNTRASLRWIFNRNRTGFSLGAGWNQDRYEQQTELDRTRLAWEASFTRRMSPVLELSLGAILNQEDFDNTGLESDELNVFASVTRQLGRTLALSASLNRSGRTTSNNLGEYEENRVFLSLIYSPLGGSRSGPQ